MPKIGLSVIANNADPDVMLQNNCSVSALFIYLSTIWLWVSSLKQGQEQFARNT